MCKNYYDITCIYHLNLFTSGIYQHFLDILYVVTVVCFMFYFVIILCLDLFISHGSNNVSDQCLQYLARGLLKSVLYISQYKCCSGGMRIFIVVLFLFIYVFIYSWELG